MHAAEIGRHQSEEDAMETKRWIDLGLQVIRHPDVRAGIKHLVQKIPTETLERVGLGRNGGAAWIAGAAAVLAIGVVAGASLALLAGPDGEKNRVALSVQVQRLKRQLMQAARGVSHEVAHESGDGPPSRARSARQS
jgi:hypothetical protein